MVVTVHQLYNMMQTQLVKRDTETKSITSIGIFASANSSLSVTAGDIKGWQLLNQQQSVSKLKPASLTFYRIPRNDELKRKMLFIVVTSPQCPKKLHVRMNKQRAKTVRTTNLYGVISY